MSNETKKPFSQWHNGLAIAARDLIKHLRADGTVSMSMDNFAAMLVRRAPRGGPTGTNAQYMFFRHWVPGAVGCLSLRDRAFILDADQYRDAAPYRRPVLGR
jgi:hypothetical protein